MRLSLTSQIWALPFLWAYLSPHPHQWPGQQSYSGWLTQWWFFPQVTLPEFLNSALNPRSCLHPAIQYFQGTHWIPGAPDIVMETTSDLRCKGWTWDSKQRIHGGSEERQRGKAILATVHLLWEDLLPSQAGPETNHRWTIIRRYLYWNELAAVLNRTIITRSQTLGIMAESHCCQTRVWGFPSSLVVKNLPDNAEDTGSHVPSLGQEDTLEKETATHSNILAMDNPMDRGAWWARIHGVAKN